MSSAVEILRLFENLSQHFRLNKPPGHVGEQTGSLYIFLRSFLRFLQADTNYIYHDV